MRQSPFKLRVSQNREDRLSGTARHPLGMPDTCFTGMQGQLRKTAPLTPRWVKSSASGENWTIEALDIASEALDIASPTT
jgi:hypothetical protein